MATMAGIASATLRKVRCFAAWSLLAAVLCAGNRGFKPGLHAIWSEATWAAAPVVQVDIVADPHVTSPAAEIGDCDSHERFLVQAVVTPCRTHVVVLSHIGGLYGP
jgi:hypothetical protein